MSCNLKYSFDDRLQLFVVHLSHYLQFNANNSETNYSFKRDNCIFAAQKTFIENASYEHNKDRFRSEKQSKRP